MTKLARLACFQADPAVPDSKAIRIFRLKLLSRDALHGRALPPSFFSAIGNVDLNRISPPWHDQ